MAGSIDNADGDPGFQIAPMVDVVFVLLLFFMATVGAKVLKVAELPATLPTHAEGTSQLVAVNIEIESDGRVILNDQVLGQASDRELPELRGFFTAAHARFGKGDPLTLHPAGDVPQQRIMEVLSACVAAGVPNVTFR